MNVGFVQFAPSLGNRDATIKHLESLAPSFASADLVVLPELCNSGYNFGSFERAWDSSEELHTSVFLSYLINLCSVHRYHIVTGFNERAGDVLYNSAALIGPSGVIGLYRKMHLFMNERDYFCPGDVGLPVFQIDGVKIGMLICFDWRFPEVWRILALKGADIICHPSNLVIPGHAQKVVPVHALANRVFVVTANRIGAEGDLRFTGMSLVADPDGAVIAMGPDAQENVTIVGIDPARARDKAVTPRNHLFGDRRPAEYGALIEPGIADADNREDT